jgi:hypothetical protein
MFSLIQLCSYILFLISIPLVSALKLDVVAHAGHESKSKERCIRNFVAKDQLVVVTAIVDGQRKDGQLLNMHVSSFTFPVSNPLANRTDFLSPPLQIRDAVGNDYHKPKDVIGENRYAFTSHSDSAFDVCFENILTICPFRPSPSPSPYPYP